ncbi:hypothetical protein IV60_GL000592 [Lancefieldella rimae]|uniref:Phage capsid-like C-terminal domain-containing protein n=2 Tax=Lancefieldella rimae TaxID=1383 RepID=B9CLK3_LANR4|nr:phage major capsid protein [Lancefieldella rimae]EEE17288.1 hypothetical protein ATORI0001_1179 [Lancefieldella rimae ATCC 49626]KRO02171.1 hypothetical protein IV60_GL000592 [Lancefieldella rimae]
MPITLNNISRDASKQLAAAFASEDTQQIEEGFAALQLAIAEDVAAQYKEAVATNDAAILSARGFRQLTSTETKYYESVIEALKSDAPMQAFASIPDKALPVTVIDDVMRNITKDHPLLAKVHITPTGAVTRYVRNRHGSKRAVWGALDAAIATEITSDFDVIDITQGKLSCFAIVTRDMLALGPTWLDGYVRAVLTEAIADGLEYGIVAGKGAAGEPTGLNRKIAKDADYNATTGYKEKTAELVTTFEPKEYGKLVAKLAKNEGGKDKGAGALASLSLICNSTDYLTKIMPASTTQTPDGRYVNGLFPVPTEVIESAAVADGKAILALLGEYDMFVGGDRGIEYSDDFKFLNDQRVFKVVTYANGIAYDDTTALVLDLSKLEPQYLNVTVKGEVKTKA